MVLLELEGTYKSLENLINPRNGCPPHFSMVLAGVTKGDRVSGAKFAVPCVGTTDGSNLNPGCWALRYCTLERAKGRTNGRLFTMNLKNGKLYEFEKAFYGVLEEIQVLRPDLIPDTVDVKEDYGILRSLRRGVTSHALNMGVDKELVKAVNRWRVEHDAHGVPNLDMADVYARLDSILPTVLRYSRAL